MKCFQRNFTSATNATISSLLITNLLLAAASVARAERQEDSHPVACLSAQGELCTVYSPVVALSIQVVEGSPVISLFALPKAPLSAAEPGPNDGATAAADTSSALLLPVDQVLRGLTEIKKVDVYADLEERVQKGELSTDEADWIEAELAAVKELTYRLPPGPVELNDALGFARDTVLSPEDHASMINVHVQITLGIRPITADYLVFHLGTSAIKPNRN